jgi:hypothetical protein
MFKTSPNLSKGEERFYQCLLLEATDDTSLGRSTIFNAEPSKRAFSIPSHWEAHYQIFKLISN